MIYACHVFCGFALCLLHLAYKIYMWERFIESIGLVFFVVAHFFPPSSSDIYIFFFFYDLHFTLKHLPAILLSSKKEDIPVWIWKVPKGPCIEDWRSGLQPTGLWGWGGRTLGEEPGERKWGHWEPVPSLLIFAWPMVRQRPPPPPAALTAFITTLWHHKLVWGSLTCCPVFTNVLL